MPADIILYALIAAGLVFWLKNILGTRHGEERERPNPFTQPIEEARDDASLGRDESNVISLDLRQEEGGPDLPRNVTLSLDAESALSEISKADRSFNLIAFLEGAPDAFAYVVEAFAEGDRETLKDLLAPGVYALFDKAIKARDKKGESVSTEIHAVRHVDILEAKIENKTAYLTVRFTADETCIIRDKEGIILAGDPDRVTEMIDVWVFGRKIKSKDPRWLVYETRDGDVIEEHKTPLPDTDNPA